MASNTLRSTSLPRVQQKPRSRCGRTALERIVHLHRRLSHEHFVTSESLARELEVTSRTIKRDIELMRDRLGVPIAWDAGTHSYTYTAHCDLLPLLRIEADEALALALAGKTFAAWRGSPLGRALTSALEKVATIVGGTISLPADALAELLFAAEDPAADAEHRHFGFLLEAIHRRRELRMRYQKPKANTATESRTIHPLHLAYLDHRWIVIGHDVARGAVRNFMLARIRSIEPTGARFETPANFDRDAYLRGSLGRFVGPSDHDVRIWFDADVAPYLRERPWHPTQSITESADGSIEVYFRLNHLNDIERRVLACGAHAEVIAPAELRARLRRAALAMSARYGESDATFSASETCRTKCRPERATLEQDILNRGTAVSRCEGEDTQCPS